MLKNYLKIAGRSIRKNKIYSLINVFGLSVGLACSIIIVLFVINELTYDHHLPDTDRLYRVISHRKAATGEYWSASLPGPLAVTLKQELPQVEYAVRLVPPYENAGHVLAVRGEKRFFEKKIFFADPEISQVFGITFLQGSPHLALDRPNTVIVTRSMALKYFGESNPLGDTIRLEFDYDRGPDRVHLEEFTITGVIEDPPPNTHLKYHMLVSMETMRKNLTSFEQDWFNPKTKYCYIKLKEGIDSNQVQDRLQHYAGIFVEKIEKRIKGIIGKVKYYLQPVKDIHLHTLSIREPEPRGNWFYIYSYALIAGLVLLIGCMNFINLSTALSTNRAREVGLRKVIGARQGQLIWQFLGEAKIITLISMIGALGVAALLLPIFNRMAGTDLSLSGLAHPLVLLALLGLFVLVGISSGIFPAFILTRLRPVTILQERSKLKLKGSFLQKFLVIGQFAISVFLVICTLFVYKQLSFMQGKALGFDKEQKLILRVKSNLGYLRRNYEAIKDSFLQNPCIKGAAVSSFVPGDKGRGGYHLWKEGANRRGSKFIKVITAGADFIPLYGLKIIEGRDFNKKNPTDKRKAFIINETAARVLGYSSPKDILGKDYTAHYHGETKKIIGVIQDFHFRGMQSRIEPLLIDIEPSLFNTLTLKIDTTKLNTVMPFVMNMWAEHFPKVPMEYSFLDDDFDRIYRYEKQMSRWLNIITVLGLIIACLGLSGLASFLAWNRQKEIGIRKVLGASTTEIVRILSYQFILLVALAVLIATPLARLALKEWLANFAYRTDLGIGIFLGASLTALFLAFLSILYQGIRAASRNPVNTLRNE